MTTTGLPRSGACGRRRRSATAISAAVVTLATSVAVTTMPGRPAEAGLGWPSGTVTHPETVSADAMPTVQIDGVVWAQEIVGNTVYVGGEFSNARPAGSAPGQNETTRSNFLAYDLTTGALRTDIVLNTNGVVRAIAASPDGSHVYVGGTFTQMGGQPRQRLAAIDVATNTLDPDFVPQPNGGVQAIATFADTVYVGGAFTAFGGTARGRLAALDSDGGLLAFDPTVDRSINALTVSPDGGKVAIGGSFENLNGSTTYRGLAFVNAANGNTLPMAANTIIYSGGENGAITSLDSDSSFVFGSSYSFGANSGGLEGRFAVRWDTGAIHWLDDCHGDSYSVHVEGEVVYTASHSHYCGNIGGFPEHDPRFWRRSQALTRAVAGTITRDRLGFRNFEGLPRPDLLNFHPTFDTGTFTGATQGPWTVNGNSRYILMGGEFTTVNGTPQQGLVRFQTRAFAANAQGPRDNNQNFPIRVWSDAAGKVTISWRANEDRDDADLTYTVHRRPVGVFGATVLHQRTVTAADWNLPTMTFTDITGTPGVTYEYRVQATDGYPSSPRANTSWVTATVASSGTRSGYLDSVLRSNPDSLWRLDESSGSSAADRVGWRDGTRTGGGISSVNGVPGIGGRANTFTGATNSFISTASEEYPPHEFSLEAWFRAAPNANGGLIIGFNSSNSDAGSSTTQDRHLYMDPQGRIRFGLNASTAQTIGTSANYRDNDWHHVVATSGPNGMQLYVDAGLVAEDSDLSNGGRTGYWGFWRIGGGSIDGFTNANSGTGRWFDGTLDEVAMYNHVLPGADIAGHYAAAGFDPPNALPTADFSSSVAGDGRTVNFNGNLSTDSDGAIASYRWDFGDGSPVVTSASSTVSHTFPAVDDYVVSLRVTDDEGGQHTTARTISTVPPGSLPTWTDQTIASMRVGVPFSDAVAATSSPPPSYSLVRGALPTGVDLDPATGSITGTPSVAGVYAFTIRADNGVGDGVEADFNVTVNPESGSLLTVDLAPAGTTATGSSVQFSGTGLLTGAALDVMLDGQPFISDQIVGGESIVFNGTLPALATGVHTIVITTTTLAGNPVQVSQPFIVDWSGALAATPNGAGYQGLQPFRVLDTREGAGKVQADGEYRLAVDPSWAVPGDTVAVVLNVTAAEPESGGFLTVYPCGTPRPLASALNYLPGQVVPNLVVVPIGELREICIYSLATSHVVADLNGYFAPSAAPRLAGTQPVRLVDTRDTAKLTQGQVLEVQVTGDGLAPVGSQSAVINVTVTEPESAGFLTLFPCDQTMPTASNVNYQPGQTVANQAFVTLSATGTACVFTLAPSHVVLDLNAWFRSGETPELVSLVPVRVLDTRNTVKMQAGETIELPLAGVGGINGATAFALNTTIAEPDGPGFVTFYPCGQEMPLASSINFTSAGQVLANHTTATVGSNGATCIFASTATQVIVDVEGVYIPLG